MKFQIVVANAENEDEFQSVFESCGDSDPAGILNEDGEIIGLVVHNKDELKRVLEGDH